MEWRRKDVVPSLSFSFFPKNFLVLFYRPNKEESIVNECGFSLSIIHTYIVLSQVT